MAKEYEKWHLPFLKDELTLKEANNTLHGVKCYFPNFYRIKPRFSTNLSS